jgi:hypothetical protein
MDPWTNFKNLIFRSEYYFLVMGILSFLDIFTDMISAFQFQASNEWIYFIFSTLSILISIKIN